MDFKDSVILPREDFIELQTAAWNSPPITPKQRLGTIVTMFAFFTFASAGTVAGAWGVAKALDWFEKRKQERATLHSSVRKVRSV